MKVTIKDLVGKSYRNLRGLRICSLRIFRHGLAFSAQLFEVIDDLSNSKYCARLPDLGDARVSPHRKDQSRLDRQAPQLLRLPR